MWPVHPPGPAKQHWQLGVAGLRAFSLSQAVAAAQAGVISVSHGTAPRRAEASELQQQQHSKSLSCHSAHIRRSGCHTASQSALSCWPAHWYRCRRIQQCQSCYMTYSLVVRSWQLTPSLSDRQNRSPWVTTSSPRPTCRLGDVSIIVVLESET